MTEVKITMREARIIAKLTQDDVARALNVSRRTVHSWEKGETAPTVEKAREFCNLCQIPYDAITFLHRDAIK